jgi:hypothetical protein
MLKMGVGTAGLPDGIFYIPKTSILVFFGRFYCPCDFLGVYPGNEWFQSGHVCPGLYVDT